MSDIQINIYGGNNQILPNATEAVQNFYGSPSAGNQLSGKPQDELPAEAQRLLLYINKEKLPHYLSLIGECRSATEFGKAVVEMYSQEPNLTKEEIVKERFISLLLPFATKLDGGKGIDNLRARINDALEKLPKQRPK